MIEYAGHAIAALAAVVAIRGNTFNPNKVGIRKITSVGWISLLVITLGLTASILSTIQENRDQARVVQQLDASEEREKDLSDKAVGLRRRMESLSFDLADTTKKLDNANASIDKLDEQLKNDAAKQLKLTSAPELVLEPWAERYYEDKEATVTLKNRGGQMIDPSVTDRTMLRVAIRNAMDCPPLSFSSEQYSLSNSRVNYYPLRNRSVSYDGRVNVEDEDLYSFDLLDLYKQSENIGIAISEAGGFRRGCIDIQPVLFIKVTLKNFSGVNLSWYGMYSFEHYPGIDFRYERHKFNAEGWEEMSTLHSNFADKHGSIKTDDFASIVIGDIKN